jgi:hypothetical protein
MKWVRTQESFLKTIKSALGINSLVSVSKLIEDLLKDEKEFTKNQHQIPTSHGNNRYSFSFKREIMSHIFEFRIELSEDWKKVSSDLFLVNFDIVYKTTRFQEFGAHLEKNEVVDWLNKRIGIGESYCKHEVEWVEFSEEFPKEDIRDLVSEIDDFVDSIKIDKFIPFVLIPSKSYFFHNKSGWIIKFGVSCSYKEWAKRSIKIMESIKNIEKRSDMMGLNIDVRGFDDYMYKHDFQIKITKK